MTRTVELTIQEPTFSTAFVLAPIRRTLYKWYDRFEDRSCWTLFLMGSRRGLATTTALIVYRVKQHLPPDLL